MGKQFREKEYEMCNGNNSHHTHPGRVWGILHVIKYHHWRHVKRRLTQRRLGCGGRTYASDELPQTFDDFLIDSAQEHDKPNTELSDVEEKAVHCTPSSRYSLKSRIKSLLPEDVYRKKGHKRSSTCPAKSQLTRVNSVHHLEVDPLSELLLTAENPEPVLETFQNHLEAGTLDVLSPVFSGKSVTSNDKCVECGTMFSSDILEHKHHKQLTDGKNLSSPNECAPEEKLINAKIFTTDASPHLFKDFLDALDLINANKDFLLKYIQDPGSPLPFHSPDQQSLRSKSRRAKSISLPVLSSSSGTKGSGVSPLINHMVDELYSARGEIRSHMPSVSMSECSEDFHRRSMSSGSSHKDDQFLGPDEEWVERNHPSSSSFSSNGVRTRHFKDLRRKLKHIIEENKNEKYRIAMDAVLDKIPSGNRFSRTVKKLMHDKQFKELTGEGKDSATNGYSSRLFSHSFNKRLLSSSTRTSSLRDSANKYSQLYETCFNSEAKCPKTECLKLRTEERSSLLKTPKSFKRFLSLPNLKSYFHQNEEPSVPSSPLNSIKIYGDRTTSTSVSDDSKSQIPLPVLADNTIPETSLKADQKNLLVRSASKSGLDVNSEAKDDKSAGNDEGSACNEMDIGPVTPMQVEASSVFSSDTSFLDVTFELENLNLPEESDSELKPGPADGFDNMAEQQETKVDHPEVVDNVENFQKFGTLSKQFVYEIPSIEVDESNKPAFNYVRKVLELSGFTSHDTQGIWYSDDQPVDPSIYEELEGCLLLDPDCSGNCDEDGQCNHLLLFDVINEGLMEIFGRSYSYYPKPLSSLSYVQPLPAGGDVLYKVWTLISWYLNSNFDAYQSLDYYVSKDLAKNDGWMNLQFDSECVGLELDDLIFDDLLEEFIYT